MRHARPPPVLLVLAVLLAGCGLAGGIASIGDGTPTAAEAAGRLATEPLEDWDCGYAFTVGTPDQEVRLSLWFDGGRGSPPEPGTHELGGAWTGELIAGSDLFAQWCDDVMAPDEPEVVEDAEWVVEGVLAWRLEDGDGQCPSVATGTLTGASVVVDGEEGVALGDVEFRNEAFGCVAG